MDQLEQMFTERVQASLTTLEGLCDLADTAKESGKEATRLVGAFDQVGALYALEMMQTDAMLKAEGSKETPDLAVTQTLAERLTSAERALAELIPVREALAVQAGTDRTEGDALASQVRGMLQAGLPLAAEVTTQAEALVARWAASTPTRTKGAGSGTRAPSGQGQGIHVELKCSCGWVQHDSTNPNSARWAVLKHLEANKQSHPTITVKPGKGEPDWLKVTEAVKPVAGGEQGQAKSEALSDGSTIQVTAAG